MPTISELTPATAVDPADELPISQGGSAHAISVGMLLGSTQPAIMAPTGSLLGRLSLGPGGPEPISIGVGLTLASGTLAATGAGGQPADAAGNVAALPVASSISSSDLVAINQNGTNAAISYANLIDGQTIDEVAPAAPTGDTDEFWVAQGSNTLLRQTFAAVWAWLATKLPSYKPPVVEIHVNTTLDGTVHNGRLLVCSAPVTLTPVFVNMGSGFCCEVLNLSGGPVTFGAGITVVSGGTSLPAGQAALLRALTYSQGNVVLAIPVGGSTAAAIPGAVSGFASTAVTSNSIAVGWTAPTAGGGVTGYTIQYRQTGTTNWFSQTAAGTATAAIITGLTAATSYDLAVIPQNAAGSGPTSSLISVLTGGSAVLPPGQVANVAVSSVSANSVTLTWAAPSTGGAVTSYTVQYAPAGNPSWTTFGTGITVMTATVTGLSSASTYNFQVFAVNAGGAGPVSATAAASTAAAGNPVTAITWNLPPASSYAVGSGAIGTNVHVTPSTSAVRFGLSTSQTVAPTAWVAGTYVNADLWGVYLGTPTLAGTYYVWCEGADGSSPTVYPNPITVS